MDIKNQAKVWRKENGYTDKGGVIVILSDEIQGWVNELRDPQHWQPGCIAIDNNGNEWIATGGNNYDGADSWQSHIIETK